MLGELNEQHVRKTAVQLGIPGDFVRKDYYVTKAIQALTKIENEFFLLVFQGGTSLSKGYQVINRLSEDADLKNEQEARACSKSPKDKKERMWSISSLGNCKIGL